VDHSRLDAKEVERIKEEYNTLIENYGVVIRSVTRIVRTDLESPSILQMQIFLSRQLKS
jgi:NTE family protein